MAQPTVDQVLELIDQLADDDRLALQRRLSEQLDAAWGEAVARNRALAEQHGVTEASIDAAIRRRRYGE